MAAVGRFPLGRAGRSVCEVDSVEDAGAEGECNGLVESGLSRPGNCLGLLRSDGDCMVP